MFICSDSLLTIPTMTGLRHLLMERGDVELRDLDGSSEETDYPMLLLDFVKTGQSGAVSRNTRTIDRGAILSTPNLSWGITPELSRLFSGPLLGNRFVASSGMTTGKNELFVREVDGGRQISEPYRFEFHDAAVTLEYELQRARLGKLSAKRRRELADAETNCETERRVRAAPLGEPLTIQVPDPRYRPYNKANNRLQFSHPTHYIYWEDDGDAVLTYKRTGNWYLRGVGGQPYFGREGITWPLVATWFNARYLPPGYILDSGAPCAFDAEEMISYYGVLGGFLSGSSRFYRASWRVNDRSGNNRFGRDYWLRSWVNVNVPGADEINLPFRLDFTGEPSAEPAAVSVAARPRRAQKRWSVVSVVDDRPRRIGRNDLPKGEAGGPHQ